MSAAPGDRIVEWNDLVPVPVPRCGRFRVHDETLRDGLQSPSVRQPGLDHKHNLLARMAALEIDSVDLGMPVTSEIVRRQVTELAAGVASGGWRPELACAARSVPADVAAVASVAQDAGVAVRAMIFIGASPVRGYVEQWATADMVRMVHDAVRLASREGIRACVVTEDTTRSRLATTLDVYVAGLDAGADRVCVCDTVGYATPWSAAAVVVGLRRGLARRGFPDAEMEWHGHNDRGLAVANSLAALVAGADCVHGTALGFGERAGNAPMEQLLANLADLGWREGDLTGLPEYCAAAARACDIAIPGNHPLVGSDAYRTMTGVHAAAIRKALQQGDAWLAERIYSGIPAGAVGRVQSVEVGPGSGRANILHWLDSQGIAHDPAVIRAIVQTVAAAVRVLTDHELLGVVSAVADSRSHDGRAVA